MFQDSMTSSLDGEDSNAFKVFVKNGICSPDDVIPYKECAQDVQGPECFLQYHKREVAC